MTGEHSLVNNLRSYNSGHPEYAVMSTVVLAFLSCYTNVPLYQLLLIYLLP